MGVPHRLAADGNTKRLAKYLDEWNGINDLEQNGFTPLHHSAFNGHYSTCKMLIEKGARVNARSTNNDTPFYSAVDGGKIRVAKLLLENGAKINIRDTSGQTPLHGLLLLVGTGVIEKPEKMLKFLIENKANVNTKDNFNHSPLHTAVSKDLRECAKMLIDAGAKVNARNSGGDTPLHFVKSEETAKLLVENGAYINACGLMKRTPLVSCLNSNYTSPPANLAKFFIENGADIIAGDKYGSTALHYAAKMPAEIEVLEMLAKRNEAKINLYDGMGHTPLDNAISAGNSAGARVLLNAGANLFLTNPEFPLSLQITPFQTAVESSSDGVKREIMNFLSTDPMKRWDNTGKTALHLAVKLGEKNALAKLAKEKGVDVNVCDDYGETALFLLAEKDTEKNVSMAKTLIEAGADPYMKTKHKDYSPFGRAKQLGNKNLTKLFESMRNQVGNVKPSDTPRKTSDSRTPQKIPR